MTNYTITHHPYVIKTFAAKTFSISSEFSDDMLERIL